MVLVYLLLLVAIMLINRTFFGMKIMPTDVFSVIWCIFAATASLGVLGYYPTNFTTNMMIIVTILVFNGAFILFYGLGNKNYNSISDKKETDILKNTHINFWVMIGLNVVSWAVSLPYLKNTIRVILTEGFEALRYYTYQYGEDGNLVNQIVSTNAQLFFTWIVLPVFTATMAITGVLLMIKHKHRVVFLAVSIIDAFVYVALFGGRGIILKLVSLILISAIITGEKKPLQFIVKHKALLAVVSVLFIVLVWLTLQRSFAGMSVLENIYAYVAAPFIFLQTVLEEYPLTTTPTLWGTATIGGIVSVIGIVGKIFFGVDFAAPENTIPLVTGGYLQIGEGITFNSMTTMIYPFLRDYGYAGIVVGPAIFAMAVAFVCRNYEKNRTLRGLCIFVYLFHTVIFSVQNYTFFKLEAWMILVFIFVFTTKVKIKNGSIYFS
ncbi:MAG: oligosaccharide repeat unit polymerase [Ruminococcaceae bacterium]|nr:oligosaccharide repeat unit polymerase [Oscillospiraceae bacterium]